MQDYSDPLHNARRLERAMNQALLDAENRPALPNMEAQETDGEIALTRGLDEWVQDIVEPTGRVTEHPILDRYINQGIEWAEKSYKNRDFQWCGAFAAWCWRDAVRREIRRKCFPSTYRLYTWAYKTERRIKDLDSARAGDIVVVGKNKRWGDHITIFERWGDDGEFFTVEGNAWGQTPQSGRREGVIRRARDVDEITAIYRPLELDR